MMSLRSAFATTRVAGGALRRAVAVPARGMADGGDYDLVVIGGGPGGYVAVRNRYDVKLLTQQRWCSGCSSVGWCAIDSSNATRNVRLIHSCTRTFFPSLSL